MAISIDTHTSWISETTSANYSIKNKKKTIEKKLKAISLSWKILMHYNKRANTNLFSNADRIKYHQQYNEKGERYLAQNKFYGTFVCEVAFPLLFSLYY